MKNNKQEKWTRIFANKRRATEKGDVTLNILEQYELLKDIGLLSDESNFNDDWIESLKRCETNEEIRNKIITKLILT